MKSLTLKHGNALVVIAHPDDETVWMGGTILENPHVRWTIFSLCRGDDPDRAPRFRHVSKKYGATPIITNVEDEEVMSVTESITVISRMIRKHLSQKRFVYLFTHGANGEYGHPRHVGVHLAVKKLITGKKIVCDSLYFFSYRSPAYPVVINNIQLANSYIQISQERLREKKNVIKKLYGFSQGSFENRACLQTETFTHRLPLRNDL